MKQLSTSKRITAYQIVMGGETVPVVCPVLGAITEESIGPIPIPPNTGKYWPIANTPIPVSFEPIDVIVCFSGQTQSV